MPQILKVKIMGNRASYLDIYVEERVWIGEGVLEGRGAKLNSREEWRMISTRRVGVLDTVDWRRPDT